MLKMYHQHAQSLINKRRGVGRADIPTTAPAPVTAQPAVLGSPSLMKRLVIGEDDQVPLAGMAVRAMRWACANMMMYVCVRGTQAAAN